MEASVKAVFTLLSVGIMAASAINASAGPCTDRIEQIEGAVRARLEKIVAAGPSAPEGVGARLHHQPTVSSIAAEESQLGQLPQATIDHVKSALAQAHDADRLGDADVCERALSEIEKLIRR
jgi:hypothetical protein